MVKWHIAKQIVAKYQDAEVELAKGQKISKVIRKPSITSKPRRMPFAIGLDWWWASYNDTKDGLWNPLEDLPKPAEMDQYPDDYVAYPKALVKKGWLCEESTSKLCAKNWLDDSAVINMAMNIENNQCIWWMN